MTHPSIRIGGSVDSEANQTELRYDKPSGEVRVSMESAAEQTVALTKQNITLPSLAQILGLTTAITANSTTTTAPAGSLAVTTHATGLGKLFYSDGSKWQLIVVV